VLRVAENSRGTIKRHTNLNPRLFSMQQENAPIGQFRESNQSEARCAVCYTVEDSDLNTSFPGGQPSPSWHIEGLKPGGPPCGPFVNDGLKINNV